MMQLQDDDSKLLAQIGKHYPQMVVLLERVRAEELERLAITNTDNFPMLKGRVGMLTELLKQLKAQ